MLDELRGLLNYIGRTADAQQQREAMIDLLIWTMYADNVIALPENERIDQLTDEMEWESPTPPNLYVNTSIARVRDALDNEDNAAKLMESIHSRLRTDEMRQEAYSACRDLAKADGEVVDEEMKFLNSVKKRFDLT